MVTVKGHHPIQEAVACKLAGIGSVPPGEQDAMISRACITAADMSDEACEQVRLRERAEFHQTLLGMAAHFAVAIEYLGGYRQQQIAWGDARNRVLELAFKYAPDQPEEPQNASQD